MRILFVHKEIGNFFGGQENHIKELAKRLALIGHKITILTEKGKTKDPLDEIKKIRNIKVVYLPHLELAHSFGLRKIKNTVGAGVKSSMGITKILRGINAVPWRLKTVLYLLKHKNEFDIISVHKLMDTRSMQLINKFIKMPYVEFLEGYDYIEAENAKKVKNVVTISKYIQEKCVSDHGFKPQVIPIGVDIATFQKADNKKIREIRKKFAPNNEILILNVSRLTPNKDIPTMIRAAAATIKEHKNVKFVVCGTGEDQKLLENLIQKHNLEQYFFLVPAVGNELPPFYKAADVFIHIPKFGIHFNIVYIEAMAAGLPIIGANIEAGPDILGDAALLVEPENVEMLAQAFLKLIKIKKLRTKLANNSRKRANVFDWNNIIYDYEKLYKSVLNHSAK